MAWCSSCSSCARPASKSASVICGVVDGSVPPPVAWGLLTVKHEKRLASIVVLVPDPTLPAEPGCTAMTLMSALARPHGIIVSPGGCPQVIPFVLSCLWPLYTQMHVAP